MPLIVCRFFVFSNLYLLKGFSIYFAYNDEVERETAQYYYYFMTSFIYFKFDNLYRQPWQAFMKVLFWSWKDTMECCMLLGLSVESTLKSSCCPMPLDWFNNFTPLGTTIMDFCPPSVWYLLQWKNVHQLMASHFHAFPWPTLQFSTLLYHLRTSFENYKNILSEIYNFLISISITNLSCSIFKSDSITCKRGIRLHSSFYFISSWIPNSFDKYTVK